jgi:hypothetical protein
MGYIERSDHPYNYALADGFTVGDQYFQSTFTETCTVLGFELDFATPLCHWIPRLLAPLEALRRM